MNRMVKRTRKPKGVKTVSLQEAVERTMEVRKCTRRQAEEWLREAFASGEIRTYFVPDRQPGEKLQ